jgi:hypothetical protein
MMTVWLAVAVTVLGQNGGLLYRIEGGFGPRSVGRLALLATIPVGRGLYLAMRLPWEFERYRLTNRRVAIERGLNTKVEQSVDHPCFEGGRYEGRACSFTAT